MDLKRITIARRLASLALAAALAFGGVQALASHDTNDASTHEEVAGGTWSFRMAPGAGTNGATWS